MIISVSEAKAKLSKLIDLVYHGENVTITNNNLPIADLVLHKKKGKRNLGLLKGKIHIPENFNDEDQERHVLW